MVGLHSRRYAGVLDGPYEPWACIAIDRFEREIEAFYRRSRFSVVT